MNKIQFEEPKTTLENKEIIQAESEPCVEKNDEITLKSKYERLVDYLKVSKVNSGAQTKKDIGSSKGKNSSKKKTLKAKRK